VLAFALRRLTCERVTVLAAQRTGVAPSLDLGAALPPAAISRLRLARLDAAALNDLLSQRLGVRFLRPLLLQLHRVSAGNPFVALELACAAVRDRDLRLDDRLPIPETLRLLVRRRFAELSPSARDALLAVSALSHPSVGILAPVVPETSLAEAVRAGVLVRERDRLRFSHPLLASVAYDDADDEE